MSLFLDDVGIVCLLVALCAIALIVRRTLLRRGGAVLDLCVRPRGASGHWVLGLARYSGDDMQWYRMLGPSLRPSRTFTRSQIEVFGRRAPSRHESASFVHGAVVLECRDIDGRLDLCLPETALTGFLAWLEAMPAGSGPIRPALRPISAPRPTS